MGSLDGRVAIITGAGRGLGREHALLFAAEGACVVVNDVGAATDGSGSDDTPAHEVVEEIRTNGGKAIASNHDVADEDGAAQLVETALSAFGELHALVNNAGILRDRMLVNMTTSEWDDVMRVHLRGHFLPTRAAATYWRDRSKAGSQVAASVVNTTSTSGLFGQVGQANYAAAKSGIASLTTVAQLELDRYGVRVNAVAPAAHTRLNPPRDGSESDSRRSELDSGFDRGHPGNVSPFVAYLTTADCPIKGRVFFVHGGDIDLFQPWAIVETISKDHSWTVEELEKEGARLADVDFHLNKPY